MDKKAILAVSFGTSHPDTLEKTIAAIEADLAAVFPDRMLYRAFTSGMIIRAIQKRGDAAIDDVPAAMERMLADGVTDVIVQPTHILNGEEYEKLMAQEAPFADRFARIAYGKPLLTSIGDYIETVDVLQNWLPEKREDTAILFMGHGAEHYANAAYAMLEYALHDAEREDIVMGTVEGYPDFDAAVRRITRNPHIKKVMLYPFMIVAGDHAKNDMAGDEPDSWRSMLEAKGYQVKCNLVGLGEIDGIRKIFTAHAVAAQEDAE